jgi:hypothetical protein
MNIVRSCRDLVSVCDSELIGKRFEQGELQLDVKENFFKGEGNIFREDQVIGIMKSMFKEDATFNIVGKKSINAAIKAGIICDENIGRIDNVPFALILI